MCKTRKAYVQKHLKAREVSLSLVLPHCRSANTMFSVEWLGHKVALKANNGKYICTKKNGQLLAVSDSTGKRSL